MSEDNSNNSVNDYINFRYGRWLEYAAYHIRVSKLSIEPAELLNNVMCFMLEGDTRYLSKLFESKKNGVTELDFFVLHIIKRNVYSPRSRARYVKGQHCTELVDMQTKANISSPEDDGFDVVQAYETVRTTLDSLEVPQRDKEIFAWRFFERNVYKDWPGIERPKQLYDTYNRVLALITNIIREAHRDY